MIGKLTGLVEKYSEDSLIINAGGVGYIVYCSPSTIRDVLHGDWGADGVCDDVASVSRGPIALDLQEESCGGIVKAKEVKDDARDGSHIDVRARVGSNDVDCGARYASLFIEMQVKEDGMYLYGFKTYHEKQCFRCLLAIQGVGGKVAMAILNSLTVEDLIAAVRMGNESVFNSISGIGPKIARRIATELKNSKALTEIATNSIVSYLKPSEYKHSSKYRSEIDNVGEDRRAYDMGGNSGLNDPSKSNSRGSDQANQINQVNQVGQITKVGGRVAKKAKIFDQRSEMESRMYLVMKDAISAVTNLGFSPVRVNEIAAQMLSHGSQLLQSAAYYSNESGKVSNEKGKGRKLSKESEEDKGRRSSKEHREDVDMVSGENVKFVGKSDPVLEQFTDLEYVIKSILKQCQDKR